MTSTRYLDPWSPLAGTLPMSCSKVKTVVWCLLLAEEQQRNAALQPRAIMSSGPPAASACWKAWLALQYRHEAGVRTDAEFRAAAARILQKNQELYGRLA